MMGITVPDREMLGVKNYEIPEVQAMDRFQGAYIPPPKTKKDVNRFKNGFSSSSPLIIEEVANMAKVVEPMAPIPQTKFMDLRSQSSVATTAASSARSAHKSQHSSYVGSNYEFGVGLKKGQPNQYDSEFVKNAQHHGKAKANAKRDYKNDPTGHNLDQAKEALEKSPNYLIERRKLAVVGNSKTAGAKLQGMAKMQAQLEEENKRREMSEAHAPSKNLSRKYTLRDIINNWVQEVEVISEMLLLQAIKYPMKMARLLMMRSKIQARLWQFQEDADIEIAYTLEDFTKEMNALLDIRRKLESLDGERSKIREREIISGDSDGDEAETLQKLKEARQHLRYGVNPTDATIVGL
jgi:hypothetical protein